MKINKTFLVCAAIGGISGLMTSCSSTKVMASYTIPPQAIAAENLSKINTLKIFIKAECKTNGNNLDSSFISGILRERLAERLYQEGYYNVSDIVWGDAKGAQKAFNNAGVARSGHGYAGFFTDSHDRIATMTLTFSGEIMSADKVGEKDFTLKEIPYTKYVDKHGVPQSEPAYNKVPVTDSKGRVKHDEQGNVIYKKVPIVIEQKVTAQYNYLEYLANCSLHAVIKDADGNTVYDRVFKNSCSRKGDANYHIARPTDAELVAKMFSAESVVDELVADISPVKVSRPLIVNGDGDEKSVMLLKAKAYSEALKLLEAVVQKGEEDDEETKANYENLGITYEILGNVTGAEMAYQKANCTAGLRRIAELKKAKKATKAAKSQRDGFKADKKDNGFNLNF